MGRLAVGVFALTWVALLASAVTLSADSAPQAAPEQDRPVPLLTQALDGLPASTDAARQGRPASSDGSSSSGEKGQEPAWVAERRACEGCPRGASAEPCCRPR